MKTPPLAHGAVRRRLQSLAGLLAVAVLGAAAAPAAQAQTPTQTDYPSRPIRVIVPLSAGGGTDVLARVVAAKLRTRLDQVVTVENRGGAAGNIGAEAVFRAPADGYTLLFTQPGPVVVNQSLYPKMPFDPTQFVPVALVSQQDILLAVRPDLPVRTLDELIAYAKANPGKLNYGSSGAGSAPHLAAEMFRSMAGLDMVHVPFKGSSESMSATLAGHVDLTFFAFSSALANVRAGKLRAIAVGGTRRNPQLPDVPAMTERLPGYSAASFTAMLAPPGTPDAVADKLAAAMAGVVADPEIQKRMHDAGDEPYALDRAQMAVFLRDEVRRWADVIKAAGIRLE